jgi:hypothetical protein
MLVLALCVIGPPIHALFYALAYKTAQLFRLPNGIEQFDAENLVQEVYSYGVLPSAIVAVVLAILMVRLGTVRAMSALLTGFIVGTLNIAYLLFDVGRQPSTVSTFWLVAMHAVTWAVAALLLCTIMVRFAGLGGSRGAAA